MRDIAKNLKSLREQKGLKQDELAEKLFVTRQTISNYENGRSRPDIEMLMCIAEIMETDVNSILYGPPVPEDKRAAHRRLIIAAVACIVFFGLWAAKLFFWDSDVPVYSGFPLYYFWFAEVTCKPIALVLIGWTFFHGMSLICKAKPLDEPWVKYCRLGTLVVTSFLLLFALVMALQFVELFITGDNILYRTISDFFLYTFVNKVEYFVYTKISNFPVLYFLLGALLWLFGFPQPRKKNTIEKSE